ncbi:four helix bundle protein [Autumnicola lenta]|uniref:four helix bundle protein n=1 Tax=Autumnicola lenta TaxID=3075593 RepID=UPI003D777F73
MVQADAEGKGICSFQTASSWWYTSIGANIEEAGAAIRRKDVIAKMSISAKEARETLYWLKLIEKSQIVKIEVSELLERSEELIRILTSIVKTSQSSTQ